MADTDRPPFEPGQVDILVDKFGRHGWMIAMAINPQGAIAWREARVAAHPEQDTYREPRPDAERDVAIAITNAQKAASSSGAQAVADVSHLESALADLQTQARSNHHGQIAGLVAATWLNGRS